MTAGVQVYEAARIEETSTRVTRHHVPWQPLTLAGVLCVTVSVNAWWIATYRRGLPFDIDEAGYLQRAVQDAQALHANGLGGIWSALRLADPQAPLVPMTGGMVRWITGAGPYGLLNVNQIFYVVAVVATYWAARSIMNRNWSLVAAIMVATLPGLVESSRGVQLGRRRHRHPHGGAGGADALGLLQVVAADPFVGGVSWGSVRCRARSSWPSSRDSSLLPP
jgi:hypothetical protein